MKILTQYRRSVIVAALLFPTLIYGQDTLKTEVANLRPYDKTGINVFEAAKENGARFNGLRVNWEQVSLNRFRD